MGEHLTAEQEREIHAYAFAQFPINVLGLSNIKMWCSECFKNEIKKKERKCLARKGVWCCTEPRAFVCLPRVSCNLSLPHSQLPDTLNLTTTLIRIYKEIEGC